MSHYVITGSVSDVPPKPLEGILIIAREHRFVDFLDHDLGSDISANNGSFKISFDHFTKPQIYLVIPDPKRNFKSVSYNQEPFERRVESSGNVSWKSQPLDIDDLSKIDITVQIIPIRTIVDKYEAVIIGSGFGGTIMSLTLANKCEQKGGRVCLLERGQWWISHEMPDKQEGRLQGAKQASIREFLDQNKMPYYNTWAYPDNSEGIFKVFGSSRPMNRNGLYDFRNLLNVHVITASGIGGGSLVYSNVTEKPPPNVYANWATETNDPPLEPYFQKAENFIGVNTITTTAGIGPFLLKRSKVFQEASKSIQTKNANDPHAPKVLNENSNFDAKLSITDISYDLFAGNGPLSKKGPISSDAINTMILDNLKTAIKTPQDQQKILAFLNDPTKAAELLTILQNTVQSPNDVQNVIKSLVDLRMNFKNEVEPIEQKYPRESNVCQRQGRCVLGCIPGARHTLNKQIYNALNPPDNKPPKPLDVYPLCEVQNIEELIGDPDGYKYKVEFYDLSLTSDQTLTEEMKKQITRTIKTKTVVLSAGSLGSTEILLKCEKLNLNKKILGSKFSTNADLLGVIIPTEPTVESTRGPIVTSIAKFDDKKGNFAFSIEDSGLPKMFAELFAYFFNVLSADRDSHIPRQNLIELVQNSLIIPILNNPKIINGLMNMIHFTDSSFTPATKSLVMHLQTLFDSIRPSSMSSPEESMNNILMLSGMGIDEPKATLTLDENKKLTLKEQYDLNQQIFQDIIDAMKQYASQIGKDKENSLIVPMWGGKEKAQFVLHPLGGCPMGNDASEGIVDHMGRVFNFKTGKPYDNFYVVDGSIIPSPLGVNPSLTIAALAFRIAENDVGKDFIPK